MRGLWVMNLQEGSFPTRELILFLEFSNFCLSLLSPNLSPTTSNFVFWGHIRLTLILLQYNWPQIIWSLLCYTLSRLNSLNFLQLFLTSIVSSTSWTKTFTETTVSPRMSAQMWSGSREQRGRTISSLFHSGYLNSMNKPKWHWFCC